MAVKLTRSRRFVHCPICAAHECTCVSEHEYTGKGENAIVMPQRYPGFLDGTARSSGVVAPERIYENGRLLYAKGALIKPEDVERLGLGSGPKEGDAPVEPKTTTRKPSTRKPAAKKKPVTPRKTVARGARRRAPAKPNEEGA